MTYLKSALVALFSLAIFTVPCIGQANVNETLETATVYVDAVNGSDARSCAQAATSTNALKTISAAITCALTNNQGSIGTKIWVEPGTYRETLSLTSTTRDTNLPMTIQAVTNGTVTISGAVTYTGWTPYSANTSIFTNSWTNDWGLCPPSSAPGAPPFPDIVQRRETVFVNGALLTQVLTLADVVAGSFFVDESANNIYVYPPAGVNLTTADVEVGTLSNLATITRAQVVLRNLTFQYANSCRDNPAVTITGASANNIVFDTLNVNWNNANAVTINNPASNFTVTNTTANHNGQSGLSGYQVKNGLWLNDTANYNNWRGAQGAIYNWNLGGFHPFSVHSSTVTGMSMYYNQTFGAHWDTDHQNITASGMVSVNNLLVGDFYEKNEGPISITNSTYCGNNLVASPQASFGAGVEFRDSMNVTLQNDYFYNNGVASLNFQGTPGGINCSTHNPECVTNWETGQQYDLQNKFLTLSGDSFWALDATQNDFQDSYLGDQNGNNDWTSFITTLNSSGNTWWNPSLNPPFEVPPTASNPLPQNVDFAGWQSATGQDISRSTFSQPALPSTACVGTVTAATRRGHNQAGKKTKANPSVVLSDAPDYWLVASASGVTIDLTGAAQNTFTLAPVGTFASSVTLSVNTSSAPGVHATLSPTTFATGSGAAAMSLTTDPGTAAGTYQIPVMATGGGLVHTSTFFVTVPPGFARLSTVNISFPNQVVSTTSAPMNVTLTNVGTTTITGITPVASSNFAQTNTCGTSLLAGASCIFSVTFSPSTLAGTYTGTLTISDSDASTQQVVNLTGNAIALATASFSPGSLLYGSVPLQTASTMTATYTDTSTQSPIYVTSILITGANTGDYSETDNCPRSPAQLAPLASCTVNVTFTPTAIGLRQANVSVTSNTVLGTQTLTMSGTGSASTANVTLTPTALSFGSITVGTNKVLTSTVKNTSSAAVTITSLTLGGANSNQFIFTDTCPRAPLTLAANGTCIITGTFTPVGLVGNLGGAVSASVTLTDTGNPTTQILNLNGTVVVPAPTTSFTPTSLTFPNTNVGMSSLPLTVILTNTSAIEPLLISSIPTTGTNLTSYLVASTCPIAPATLAPLGLCNIVVTFVPTAAKSLPASVTVFSNVSTGSSVFNLSGTGQAPTVSLTPATLAFGNQNVNVKVTKTSTIKNTSTTLPLHITSITVTGSHVASYTLSDTCPRSPATLAAGASCVVTVNLNATTTGDQSGSVTIMDDIVGGVSTIAITGTTFASATLTPTTIAFGNVDYANSLGSGVGASKTLTSILKNTSLQASLTIASIGLSGSNTRYYTESDNCGASLAAGASCTITAVFTPTISGALNSAITITDGVSAGTQTITLTGSGVLPVPTAKFAPTTLAFASVNEGTTLSKMATLTNSSTDTLAVLKITSLILAGTNSSEYTVTHNCPLSPSTLAAGASCTITAVFAPVNLNATTVTYTATDNASPATQVLTLTGTGKAVVPTTSFTPATVSFGNINEGTSSTMTSVFKNTSTSSFATLTITSIGAVTGTDSNQFVVTNACPLSPATLAAGASCTFTVVYSPTNTDSPSVTVKVTDNESAGSRTLTIKGTGLKPVPTATLTPSSLTFPSTTVGTAAAPMTTTLTNTSTNTFATLAVTTLTTTGTAAADYTATSNCPASLAAGATCVVTVNFTPAAKNTRAATLNVNSNVSGGKTTASLTGTGQ